MYPNASAGAGRQAERFQVLSLDGGGVLGIFTAAGLGAGLSAAAILEAYVEGASAVFPGPRSLRRLRQAIRPKGLPTINTLSFLAG